MWVKRPWHFTNANSPAKAPHEAFSSKASAKWKRKSKSELRQQINLRTANKNWLLANEICLSANQKL